MLPPTNGGSLTKREGPMMANPKTKLLDTSGYRIDERADGTLVLSAVPAPLLHRVLTVVGFVLFSIGLVPLFLTVPPLTLWAGAACLFLGVGLIVASVKGRKAEEWVLDRTGGTLQRRHGKVVIQSLRLDELDGAFAAEVPSQPGGASRVLTVRRRAGDPLVLAVLSAQDATKALAALAAAGLLTREGQ